MIAQPDDAEQAEAEEWPSTLREWRYAGMMDAIAGIPPTWPASLGPWVDDPLAVGEWRRGWERGHHLVASARIRASECRRNREIGS